MAYSDFTQKDLTKKFNLQIRFEDLFKKSIPKITPSQRLFDNLRIGQLAGFITEKARSERLVTPVLMELLENNDLSFTVYSGMSLDADNKQGLNGECDFILSHSSDRYMVTAPIFTIVEAKKQDIEKGVTQCAAQLLGARLFNEQEGTPLNSSLYGCSTTGIEWNFLKLEGNDLIVDIKRYYINMPAQLLGVLQRIVDETKPA